MKISPFHTVQMKNGIEIKETHESVELKIRSPMIMIMPHIRKSNPVLKDSAPMDTDSL